MIDPLSVEPALIDRVYERLVAAIADGTLQPGRRLTQERLAAMLNVSRQPVSHALQILRRRGLVVGNGKRGLLVAPHDAERLVDLYQVRAALDALAASLAASRARAGQLTRRQAQDMRSLLRRGTMLAEAASIGDLIAADVAFHSQLHRLSGNSAIGETVAEAWPHFMRSMGFSLADPAVGPRVWREHAEILDLILAGEADAAAAAARRHAESAGEETAARMRKRVSAA